MQAHSHNVGIGFAMVGTSDWTYTNGGGQAFNRGASVQSSTSGTGDSGNLQPYRVSTYLVKT